MDADDLGPMRFGIEAEVALVHPERGVCDCGSAVRSCVAIGEQVAVAVQRTFAGGRRRRG